jgi:hypothetical protein
MASLHGRLVLPQEGQSSGKYVTRSSSLLPGLVLLSQHTPLASVLK